MRIGIVSDVHANLAGLDAAVGALGSVDTLICAGDILGYYFDSSSVIDRLRTLGAICLLGNHDLYFLSHLGLAPSQSPPVAIPSPEAYRARYGPSLERAARELDVDRVTWLSNLRSQMQITLDGVRFLLVHGSPWRPVDEYVYPDYPSFPSFDDIEADVVVMGHTHRPLVRRQGKVLLVNPGSCGQPRDHDSRAACALIETHRELSCTILRTPYDRSALLAACHALDPSNTLLSDLLTRGDAPA